MKTRDILMMAATAAMLVTANLLTKVARADNTTIYTNAISSADDVAGWTRSSSSYNAANDGSLLFSNGGSATMPELNVDAGVVPTVQITAIQGSSISLYTSPTGSTYTYQGNFTGAYTSTTSTKVCPAGTRFIRFNATAGSVYLQSLTVTIPIAVTGVVLNKATTALAVGGSTETLTATVVPNNAADPSVSWSSDNASIASVDVNGVVTPVAAGTATITVTTTDGSHTATCDVTVSATSVALTGVALNKATTRLFAGRSTETLTPLFTPTNATNQNVSWGSSDGTIASVAANGVVTPVAVGTAIITVTAADGGHQATCAVTVEEPPLDTVRVAWTSGAKNFSYTANGNITVDWGNGSPVETFTSGAAYHASAYDALGAYTAIISGNNLTVLEINNQSVLAVDLSKAHSLTTLKCYNNLITDGNLILNANGSLTVDVGDNYLSAAALNALGTQFAPTSGSTTQTFTSIATVGTPVTLKGGSNSYGTIIINDGSATLGTVSAVSDVNYTISGDNITFLTEGVYRVVVGSIGSGGTHTVNNYVTVVSGYAADQQQIDITLDTKGSADSTVFSLSASYGQPFDVSWGDGTTETYDGTGEKAPTPTGATAGTSPLTLKHKYTTAGNKSVTITAPFTTLLTALNANHGNGRSVFTALDVTKAPALEGLLCENHNLATLDVRNNLWLGRLNCGYNHRLTTLQLSTATNGVAKYSSASIQVECQNNRIDTVEIGTRHDINCSNNAISLQGAYNIKQKTVIGAVIGDQNRWLSGEENVLIPLVDMVATGTTVKNSAGGTITTGFTYTPGTGITFTTNGYYTLELTHSSVTGGKVIYNFNVGMGVQSIAFDWTASTTAKTFTLAEANNRDFTVNWGDLTGVETYTGKGTGTSLTLSHTYAAAGNYTVTIAAVDGSCAFYTLDLSNTELTSLTLSAPTLTSLNVSNNRLTLSQLKGIKDQSGTASVTYGLQTLPQVITTAINVERVIDNAYTNSTVSVRKKRFADWSTATASTDYTWTQGDGKIKFLTDQWQYEVTLENAALTGASVKQTFEVGDMPSPNVKVTYRITDETVQKPKLYVDIPAGKSITVDYGDGIQTATFTAIGTDIYDITNNISYTAAGTYTITCTTTDRNDHFTKVIIQDCRAKSITVDGSSETQLAELTIQNTDADTLTFVDCTGLTATNISGNSSLVAVNGFDVSSETPNSGTVNFAESMMSMQMQATLGSNYANYYYGGGANFTLFPQRMPTQRVSINEEQVIDDRASHTSYVYTVSVVKPLNNSVDATPSTDYTLSAGEDKITFLQPGVYSVTVEDGNNYGHSKLGSIYTFVVDAALTVPKRTVLPFTVTFDDPAQWLSVNGTDGAWVQSNTEGKDGGAGVVLPDPAPNLGAGYSHLFFDVEFPPVSSIGSNTNFRLTFDYKWSAGYSPSCWLSDTSRVPSSNYVGGSIVAIYPTGDWHTETVNLPAAQYAGTVKRLVFTFRPYYSYSSALDNVSITTYQSFTVTFNTAGGTARSPINVEGGTTFAAPAAPTKDGFTFDGWYTEAGCTTAWNFASDVVTANITLYAKWLNHYTVTFNTDGGSAVAALTDVVDGATITAPSAPTKSGSTFVAWYKEAGLTNQWNFDSDVVSTNITLYAKWLVPVTGVTLNTGTLSLAVGAEETLIHTVEPGNATNQGVLWSSSDDGKASVDNTGKVTAVAVGTATITVTTNDGGYAATCNVTVTPIAVTGVTLNKSTTTLLIGGQETLTETVLPLNATNKAVTWSSSAPSIASVDNGVVTAHTAGEATITATSAADATKTATCTVTVSATSVAVTSVSLNKTSTTLLIDSTVTLTPTILPLNATNQNVSWSSSNGGVASVSNGVVTAHTVGTATITVTTADGSKTATCAVTVSATSVTVTFDAQGGSEVAPQTIAQGEKATQPTPPTKANYNFAGWYKEAGYTTPWNPNDVVTENITLYAKWIDASVPTYAVTFNVDGGTAVAQLDISRGEKVPQPNSPTKAGYTFGGWYKEAGCTTAWDFASDVVTAAVTLYAKWTEDSSVTPSNPADLSGLTIDIKMGTGTVAAVLTPAFHPDSTHYTLSLPCGDTIVTITPSAPDGGTVTVNGKPATEDVVARNVGGKHGQYSVHRRRQHAELHGGCHSTLPQHGHRSVLG